MQGYTGPAALNEGIRAIGDVFSPETAMNRQKAIMVKQQFEQTMKPITYDELAAKTSPDLWPSIQKMAESNGYAEEHNGVKFIRQGNLQEFHKQLGQNKVWQAQLLEESSKINQSKLDQIKPQFEQATKQWEASIAIYKYKAQQELEKAKEEGRPPDVPLLTKLEEQIKEAQGKYPVYKQMTQLGQQMEQTMGAYKKRITSLGLLDEGFKKDVEKYGEPDAVKIALNPEYRRQLDLKIKQDDYTAKYGAIADLKRVEAGLKTEESKYKSAGGGVIYDNTTGKPTYVKPPAPKSGGDSEKGTEFERDYKAYLKHAKEKYPKLRPMNREEFREDQVKRLAETRKSVKGNGDALAEDNTLDEKTAASILQEAGGNKDKARTIAKKRGYKF